MTWSYDKLGRATTRSRENFGTESDIDLLASFQPDRIPRPLGVADMDLELSESFSESRVDLRRPKT